MMNALDLQAGLNQSLIVKLIIYRHAQNSLHNVEVSIASDLGRADCYPPYKPENCTGLVKTCTSTIRILLLACNSPPCPVVGGAVVHNYSNRKKKDSVMFTFVIKLNSYIMQLITFFFKLLFATLFR